MMPTPLRHLSRLAALAAVPLILASCGGGGGGGGFFFPFPPPVPPVAEFTVGGSVSGLRGSGLVLQLSGSADVPVAADGAFVFGEKRGKGTGYAVSVKQQPSNPTQTCSVSDGAGTIGDANVDNVRVVCAGDAYKVSVTVTGLASNDLVLQNNGGDDLAVGADGVVSFATPVADGAAGLRGEAGLRHGGGGGGRLGDGRLFGGGGGALCLYRQRGVERPDEIHRRARWPIDGWHLGGHR